MFKSLSYRLFLVFSFCISTSFCIAQTWNHTYSQEELKADFQVLKTELEMLHPGLHLYTVQSKMDSIFQAIESSINEPSTSIAFYRKIALLNSAIKDAHSLVFCPKNYIKAINGVLPRLPFGFYEEDNKLLIIRNLSNNLDIQEGWGLLSVNGESITELRSQFYPYISRDGENTSSVTRRFYYDFSGLYALIKGCPETFELVFKDKNGAIKNVNLQALKLDEILANRSARYGEKSKVQKPIFDLKFHEDNAILTINSFDGARIKKAGIRYKKYFKKTFQEIERQGSKKLIIDIRQNNGGWDEVADVCLSYLVDFPFRSDRSDISKVKKIRNKHFYEKDGFIKHFERLRFKKQRNNEYKIKWWEGKTKPKKRHFFKGQIYVLTSPVTASQAGEFAGHLKDKTTAIFIGEEPGGTATLGCGGDVLSLVLPNTEIKVHIPLRLLDINVAAKNSGRGVLPDFPMRNPFEDERQGRDAVLEFALRKNFKKEPSH